MGINLSFTKLIDTFYDADLGARPFQSQVLCASDHPSDVFVGLVKVSMEFSG